MCGDAEMRGAGFHLDTIFRWPLIGPLFAKKKKNIKRHLPVQLTLRDVHRKSRSLKLVQREVALRQQTHPSGSLTTTVESRFQSCEDTSVATDVAALETAGTCLKHCA